MAERFANDPIAVDGLPRLADEAFVRVDPRYVWGSLAGIGIAIGVVVAGAVLWSSNTDAVAVPVVLAGVVVTALLASAVMRLLGARRLAYQLRDHDLSLRSGVVSRAVETMPFARVQHVSVTRGAVDRALGLATLTVSSAGPDISVFGLTPDDAERIKRLIAERAGVVDDDPPSEPRPLPPPAGVVPRPGGPPPSPSPS
jgi:membrane protein YdbS with pleckstrin-like domain